MYYMGTSDSRHATGKAWLRPNWPTGGYDNHTDQNKRITTHTTPHGSSVNHGPIYIVHCIHVKQELSRPFVGDFKICG